MAAPKGNKNAAGNKGGGRPSTYKENYAELAGKVAKLGATDEDLADVFDVKVSTIDSWKKRHIEFKQALKDGKAIADAEVAQSLYHRATGYSHREEKILVVGGKVQRVMTTNHYPPDTTSMIFWLKNRRPDLWRDKHNHEHTGKDGERLNAEPTITVEAAAALVANWNAGKE